MKAKLFLLILVWGIFLISCEKDPPPYEPEAITIKLSLGNKTDTFRVGDTVTIYKHITGASLYLMRPSDIQNLQWVYETFTLTSCQLIVLKEVTYSLTIIAENRDYRKRGEQEIKSISFVVLPTIEKNIVKSAKIHKPAEEILIEIKVLTSLKSLKL